MTLTEFLLARIAEDQSEAERARTHPDYPTTFARDNYGYLWIDPARVLRECEAKRQIVEAHRRADWDVQGKATCETCVSPDDWTVTDLPSRLVFPCRTLRFLASVYSDHPGYRDEWRITD